MYKKNNTYKNNFIYQIINNDLKNKKYGLIYTRFPPEPNGYLHIGHLKSICLNFTIAKDFNGKCNLRIDDTNPVKENIKYIESIKKDLIWLGFQWSKNIKYSSDYFDQLYEYAIELIKKGFAYVDELTSEEIRNYRGTLLIPGKNSPYRNRSIEENLILFNKMKLGKFSEGSASLRAKINMQSKIIVLRDPVLYRIKFIQHHQTGNKWCIYPMYDFAHCIADAIEGITHSLCTLEFQDNRLLYDWIINHISINHHPKQYEFSRLNIEYSILSKRKMNLLVNNKIVNNWNDPRMLTISGLRKRGYTASSLKEFCYRVGVTKQNNLIERVSLESCIRDELNKNAHRMMAILKPLKIIITNFPTTKEKIKIIAPNHPNNHAMGFRNIFFTKEIYINELDFIEKDIENNKKLTLKKEIRLRYSFVIKANKILKNKEKIICVYCTYDSNTLGKKLNKNRNVKGVIHWLSISHSIPAIFRIYDNLFTKKNIDFININKILSFINKKSLLIYNGFIEKNILKKKQNKSFQFEREGYFCLDKKDSNKKVLIFNQITSLKNKFKI
ncbi:glutamine--tRNA ligase [Enterobacteriaceae endosymbiont of Plateumaris consimilis]|uniref:glutamine--tRNA ligase n=1 Tax=Enterobacteriaceae endosymbiont of Plateumaris consimilis TaxID=2675794 RepID=UPI001448F87D|nr:glutamine--tRNA ligase [Enterobacteriaceae endosymbiont of Plateumaris consimilis]QJC28707.1 glutamine--tRNA ligase [Enterobacteriaceae endosymbiont of Plateumaris consimilis]